jgi:hypothetical protein
MHSESPPSDAEPGAAGRIQILLDVGPDEPIQGTLQRLAEPTVPFRGWLALTALIEAARKAEEHRTGGRPAEADPATGVDAESDT